jgi:hypothetical protein
VKLDDEDESSLEMVSTILIDGVALLCNKEHMKSLISALPPAHFAPAQLN